MSTLLLGGLLAAVPLSLAWWWWSRRQPAAPRHAAPATPLPPAPAAEPLTAPADVPTPPLPSALEGFEWQTHERMDARRRDPLLAAIRDIPRPPQALQRLLSADFMARTHTAELHALLSGEPWIAAQVLASVNSAAQALPTPVNDLGQAVQFLGVHHVRAICLQHLLAQTFKTRLPRVKQTLNTLWQASALASELAARLDAGLRLPPHGLLPTRVVLSFVGPLAMASLIPQTGLAAWLARTPLDRARYEQQLLGINACELGHLLMQRWELPQALLDGVRDAGRLLVTDAAQGHPEQLPGLALTGLCTRLGERLALGQLDTLEGYRPGDDAAADMQHLRAALAHPALASLDAALQSPALLQALGRLHAQPAA